MFPNGSEERLRGLQRARVQSADREPLETLPAVFKGPGLQSLTAVPEMVVRTLGCIITNSPVEIVSAGWDVYVCIR
jgi:hypothetical protein